MVDDGTAIDPQARRAHRGEGDLLSPAGELLGRVRYRIEVKQWVYREARRSPSKLSESHAVGWLSRIDGGLLAETAYTGRVVVSLQDGRVWKCRARSDGYAVGDMPVSSP